MFSTTVGCILNQRHSVHSGQILTPYLESSPNNLSKLQEVRISKGVHTFKNLQQVKLALIIDRMDTQTDGHSQSPCLQVLHAVKHPPPKIHSSAIQSTLHFF